MIWPAKVSRSTMAAQRRGSVKVLVQAEKGSLEAMAIAERSSRSVRTWKSSSAPRRSSCRYPSSSMQEKVDAAVAGDEFGEVFIVGGFDEFVDQLAGQGVADSVAGFGGAGAQADEQVAFAGAGVADQTQGVAGFDPVAAGELCR